jgi:hypothetical protein
MNEFNKYELQSLLWAIGYVRERTNNCGDTMRSLRTRIQEMIDNYCDYENESPSDIAYLKERGFIK